MEGMSKKDSLIFVTKNIGKFREAQLLFSEYGIELKNVKLDLTEIQADDLKDIAKHSAKEATNICGQQTIVEDAGLFIDALKGFPGPYSEYVFRKIGNEGILRLMESIHNREAEFRSVVAFCAPNGEPVCFEGVVRGRISHEARGSHGFGYDPIFIPLGEERTFAEMDSLEKNKYSHRAKAFRKFIDWFISSRRTR